MAPRTAKAKKAADVKVAENDAPKKGRGKAKNTEEPEQEVPELEIDEKPALAEKKTKRGKKAQENGDAQTNGTEEVAPPAKRGRKKKEVEPEESAPEASNGDHIDEITPAAEEEKNGNHTENDTEDAAPVANGKGRKKAAAKKEEKPKENARGRKAKQPSPDEEEKEEKVAEEKPKGKGRGRKPKAEAAPETEDDKTEPAEEAKAEPASKGRRKAPAKAAKDKSPEPEPEESTEETQDEPEEKPEAPKKEAKGRKGKKAQAKEDGDTEEKEPSSKKRKVNKKEERGQGDTKEDDASEDAPEEAEEPKPKGKRGKKEAPAPSTEADDESADSEASSKRRRKPTEEKAPAEDSKKKAPAKNKSATDYEEIDFSNHSKNPQGKEWNLKISCWNVDGIRAWMNKGGLDYIKYEKPDILCLQETKCAKEKLPEELVNLPGYHAYWVDSDKDGYAGVGLYTTKLAMNVQYGLGDKELDDEGRIITAEYEQFYLICTYVPNAGRKLVTLPKRLQWNEAFQNFVKELDKKKPVIICGDMNVAHNEIDLANPKANKKNAGFTEEERAGMTSLLGAGFVDTYRHLHPDTTGAYTFWTYMANARAKNTGWRLDYFLVSERLLGAVCDNVIRSEVYGSDHCPITLFLHITSADKPKEA